MDLPVTMQTPGEHGKSTQKGPSLESILSVGNNLSLAKKREKVNTGADCQAIVDACMGAPKNNVQMGKTCVREKVFFIHSKPKNICFSPRHPCHGQRKCVFQISDTCDWFPPQI